MKRIEFSVLQYYPSFVTGECINLGILIHCADDNFIKFEHIKNTQYNRLRTFDDELDIEVVTQMLNMLSEDIREYELPLISNQHFDMKEYIKYFANEFRFSTVTTVYYESIEAATNELKNVYLRLYLPKSERPAKDIERNLVERIIIANEFKYSKNNKVKDAFGLDIKYDFVFDDNSAGIKFFSINSGNIHIILNHLRMWALNCECSTVKNSVIVYSCEDTFQQNPTFLKAIEMLKTKTNYVVNIDALASALSTLKSSV